MRRLQRQGSTTRFIEMDDSDPVRILQGQVLPVSPAGVF